MKANKKESNWERRARICREKMATGETPARVTRAKAPSRHRAAARTDDPRLDAVISEPAATSNGPLGLEENLHHAAAAPLARALLGMRGRPAVLDGSRVKRLGAQCLQVLLSASKSWAADRIEFSVVDCSSAMVDDLRLMGLEPNSLSLLAQNQ